MLIPIRGVARIVAGASPGVKRIGESALKVRLHRARIALRESLTPYLRSAAQPVQPKRMASEPAAGEVANECE